ncbi:MAG TPA: hypothetical protein VLR88_10010 [Propionibacteriaceae bacterium]|nr:hypothetical protein [Propionibacteriaceae bacterium]
MHLTVTVITADVRPEEGTPLVVELRDTSLMDVAAVTVCRAESAVKAPWDAPEALCAVNLEAPDDLVAAGALSVFAHVRAAGVDSDGVALGDLITMQAYPVVEGAPATVVEVVKVG